MIFALDLSAARADAPAADSKMPTAAELFADQPKGLSDHIFGWKFIYVGEVLSNPIGGSHPGVIYEGYAKFGVGLNLERALGWESATLYANVLYPHGEGLTQRSVHDLNVVSNIDGYDSVRLYKLWFQKSFSEGYYSLRLGLIAADKEFFTSDSAGIFINNAFGTPTVFSQSIPGPIYPVSAPGIRLRWEPTPALSFRAAAFSGDVGTQTTYPHQVSLRLRPENGVLLLVEGAYKTRQDPNSSGLPSTFKLGTFYDRKPFADSLGGPIHDSNYGGYLVADQQMYRESSNDGSARGLSVYSRVGFAPKDRNLVDFDAEAGLNYVGLVRARARDIVGVGVAYTHISTDSRLPLGQPSAGYREELIEVSYLAPVTDWFSVQPDFQYIIHPGATSGRPNALVVGLRVILSF